MEYGYIFRPDNIALRYRNQILMIQSNVLILVGIISLIVGAFLAAESNLSELGPVFLLLGFACFGWLLYRKTWARATTTEIQPPATKLAKLSGLLAMAGLICIGLSSISLFDPALQEMALAAVLGAGLLVVALLLRITNGMLTKRVDTATGSLSIALILLLLFGLAITCLVIYMGYLLLTL